MVRLRQGRDPDEVRRTRRAEPGPIYVEVSSGSKPPRGGRKALHPQVQIRVADVALARRLAVEIKAALGQACDDKASVDLPEAITIHTNRSVSQHAASLRDAVALVDITHQHPRTIRRRVRALEAAGCAGIQLVYTFTGPMPEPSEAVVFGILEERRGNKDRVPVILTRTSALAPVWRYVLATRSSAARETTE